MSALLAIMRVIWKFRQTISFQRTPICSRRFLLLAGHNSNIKGWAKQKQDLCFFLTHKIFHTSNLFISSPGMWKMGARWTDLCTHCTAFCYHLKKTPWIHPASDMSYEDVGHTSGLQMLIFDWQLSSCESHPGTHRLKELLITQGATDFLWGTTLPKKKEKKRKETRTVAQEEIMYLVASFCPSGCPSVCALMAEQFDLWPWYSAWSSHSDLLGRQQLFT